MVIITADWQLLNIIAKHVLSEEKTVIDDFWIIDILDNELVIVYKGIQFKLRNGEWYT